MSDTKQVLVWRKDLQVRKGKLAAQVAHASLAAILSLLEVKEVEPGGYHSYSMLLRRDSPIDQWLRGSFAKICVYVENEEELLKIYQEAKDAGIISVLITDSGKTEFNGVPTNTCVAVGPDYSEKINPITGHLKLL